jgi:hypothetical protein
MASRDDRRRESRLIRTKRREGATLTALAEEFGVNPTTVHNVVHRRTWGHIIDG